MGYKKADMTTTRTHFTIRVDTWTPDGESIVEHIAGIEDYQVALATYRAERAVAFSAGGDGGRKIEIPHGETC